jgi:selenocysteine lyase/cysteine desulfurase
MKSSTDTITDTDDRVTRWRVDTPGCANRNHLNNAGAALMPKPVLDASIEHLRLEANIGGYEAAAERETEIAQVYDDIASLIGSKPGNVAVVANATAGFIQAMTSFDFAPGDVIVTTKADYTSYQIQFLALSERLGVIVEHAADLPEGGVDPASVRELASNPRCRLVHVSWVPTHSGLVQDAEEVGVVCEELGVPYLVDACQAVGQIPVNVERLKCDYLSATARKFLRGPRGMGFLFASDKALGRGDHPLYVDMRGARWVDENHYEVASTAKRYEDWEFPYALVLGLGEAVRYAMNVGIETASARALGLAARLRARLSELPRVRVLDDGRNQCAIVTAAFSGIDATDVVRELSRQRINTVASLRWFGLLTFTEKQVETAIRLSPHYYNTEEEVDAAVSAISRFLNSESP